MWLEKEKKNDGRTAAKLKREKDKTKWRKISSFFLLKTH